MIKIHLVFNFFGFWISSVCIMLIACFKFPFNKLLFKIKSSTNSVVFTMSNDPQLFPITLNYISAFFFIRTINFPFIFTNTSCHLVLILQSLIQRNTWLSGNMEINNMIGKWVQATDAPVQLSFFLSLISSCILIPWYPKHHEQSNYFLTL